MVIRAKGIYNTVKIAGVMNKTESRYWEKLAADKYDGEILHFEYEKIKFKVGDAQWYCPDFYVISKDGQIILDEVKGGHITRSGLNKFKTACMVFPFFNFRMWQYDSKKKVFNLIRSNVND